MRLEHSFVLIPGVGQATEQRLWQAGVRDWAAFPDNNVVGEAVAERGRSILEKARKNLDVGNTAFFDHYLPSKSTWRMYRDFADGACFFDIETTGLDQDRDVVTTVSFYRDGETTTLVRGEDLDRERLDQQFFDADLLVSFNGKRFDVPFLESAFDLDVETPHIDLMYLCKRLGLTGGLKQVEQDLGIDRELEDIDGREAIRLWKRYEKHNDEGALEDLVRYNRFDARNLQDVLEAVHGRLKADVFDPHHPAGD